MTGMTLDQFEAEADDLFAAQVELQLLDEVEGQGRLSGRAEALADVEDTIVETLDAMEARADEMLSTIAGWVSDLHMRFSALEEKVVRSLLDLEPEVEAEAEVLFSKVEALAQVEADLDTAEMARAHVGSAVDALSQAMYLMGEKLGGGPAAEEADDNVEYAYWCLMKAQADLCSWINDLQDEREAMLV